MANNNDNRNQNTNNTGNGRGFASMDPDKQREIASKGGKAAHESGNAHEFDSNEARDAGRKGGLSRSQNSQTQNSDRNNSTTDTSEWDSDM